jgi:hypothetical protein
MDTETEIKQRERSETNRTPAPADENGDETGDDDGGMLGGLPVPSISRKHALIIGGIVAVVVIVWWLQRDEAGDSLDDVRQNDYEGKVAVEDEEGSEQIEVPINSEDPLAGDEAVTKAFRESGRISLGEL